MSRNSTNALTKRYCEQKGWTWANTQYFYGGRRHDLFGLADCLILPGDGCLLFVQNCCYGSLKAHRDKADESFELMRLLNKAGAWIELWEWRRKKIGRKLQWFLRRQKRPWDKWMNPSAWEGPLDL